MVSEVVQAWPVFIFPIALTEITVVYLGEQIPVTCLAVLARHMPQQIIGSAETFYDARTSVHRAVERLGMTQLMFPIKKVRNVQTKRFGPHTSNPTST
jgi:hypothetical protein